MNLNGKDYVFARANGDAEWWKDSVESYSVSISMKTKQPDQLDLYSYRKNVNQWIFWTIDNF